MNYTDTPKKRNRRAPQQPAKTLGIGFRSKGVDGNQWEVRERVDGVLYWRRLKKQNPKKQKEPSYFPRLRNVLREVNNLIDIYAERGWTDQMEDLQAKFLELMEPYGLKIKHVTRQKLEKGVYVIPPQEHNYIDIIPREGGFKIDELIGKNGIFGVEEIKEKERQSGQNNSITLTTGDGTGEGDSWYVPRIGMVNELETLLNSEVITQTEKRVKRRINI